LKVHAGRSKYATPSEALYRTTLGAAQVLGAADRLGTFAIGRPAAFIEVRGEASGSTADEVILHGLLEMDDVGLPGSAALAVGAMEAGPELDAIIEDCERTASRLDRKVCRVTLGGRTVWEEEENAECKVQNAE